mmetsp:Transcript_84670/g.240160  ORF Transcript_84670/g.240160 Transcript_84670/m.240160 type:complete len:130 (+) Transcript_84670:435-824(+)
MVWVIVDVVVVVPVVIVTVVLDVRVVLVLVVVVFVAVVRVVVEGAHTGRRLPSQCGSSCGSQSGHSAQDLHPAVTSGHGEISPWDSVILTLVALLDQAVRDTPWARAPVKVNVSLIGLEKPLKSILAPE